MLRLITNRSMPLQQIVNQVIELSKQVGAFIKQERSTFDPDKIEYKGLNDMVSYVDKTAEEKIVAELEKILPEAGFITEEKTKNNLAGWGRIPTAPRGCLVVDDEFAKHAHLLSNFRSRERASKV